MTDVGVIIFLAIGVLIVIVGLVLGRQMPADHPEDDDARGVAVLRRILRRKG